MSHSFDLNNCKPYITEQAIREKIAEAGKYIDAIYDGRPILLLGILTGSFIFMADVCRAVTVPCEICFMRAKSYFNGTVSSGKVDITLDLSRNLSEYHVVILEDIIDTGRTLSVVKEALLRQNPLSLHIVTLLDKPSRREAEITAELSLFTIPDAFVVGYGLDVAEKLRTLPYIAVFEE